MVRVATFNVENLFARYRFKQSFNPVSDDGFSINDLAFEIYDETEKQITAKAIREVKADILALQEVENLKVLDSFNSRYLASMKYKHRILIDAFDPRNIDVALMSRYPVSNINTYRHERNQKNTAGLFSRDCLEVDIDVEGKTLTVYVNHFKSMMEGREVTKSRRVEQVEKVADIIDERWKKSKYEGNFVVLGDFNDYLDKNTSLSALTSHKGLVHVSERIKEKDRWTHFWAGGNEYRQLDYLLLSKSLAASNTNSPEIMRKGLPFRAEKYEGERLDFVGHDNPKASDHCPIYMDLKLD